MDPSRRYARQLALPELGPRGQARLSQSKVLVVGLGGLGCPVASYLVRAGVGTVGLCDFDSVDATNLHRQTLYAQGDIGGPKAEAAKRRLLAIDPSARLTLHPVRVTAANARQAVDGFDVVVDGTDDLDAKRALSDACQAARVPLVHGAASAWEGAVAVFPPGGPCYRCAFPSPPAEPPATCADEGVLGPVPGVVAGVQALEAIRLAAGIPSGLSGRLWTWDGSDGSTRTIELKTRPGCKGHVPEAPACPLPWAMPSSPDIGAAEFESRRGEFFVLDVREPEEFEETAIPGSTLVPLGDLPSAIDGLPRDRPIVCICAVGGRSARATMLLREHGLSAYNLRGGMRSWLALRR